jgi:hypothetical protein
MKPISAPSGQPDLRVLRRLNAVQIACDVLVALIAGAVLSGWLLPAVGSHLPGGWSLMKANTALAFLLATAAAILTQTKQRRRRVIEGRACAIVVMMIAGAALFAYSTGHPIGIETILVADSGAKMPGRMDVQTGVYLEFIGLILIFEDAARKPWIHLVDALTMTLVLLILSIFAGYVFGARRCGHWQPNRESRPALRDHGALFRGQRQRVLDSREMAVGAVRRGTLRIRVFSGDLRVCSADGAAQRPVAYGSVLRFERIEAGE